MLRPRHPLIKPVHFTPPVHFYTYVSGLCFLPWYPMSGSWVMFALSRIRQGHIFPTVVDNEASGKANGLKLFECSFWGRDGVNYSMAAALLNVGSSTRRLLWGAWISPSVSGFQKPKVKKITEKTKMKNASCSWIAGSLHVLLTRAFPPDAPIPAGFPGWKEKRNIQILLLRIFQPLEIHWLLHKKWHFPLFWQRNKCNAQRMRAYSPHHLLFKSYSQVFDWSLFEPPLSQAGRYSQGIRDVCLERI